MDADNKKPFKIKDVTRIIKKAIVASTLEEIRSKVAEKFEKSTELLPTIHLDSDGTEIDDEEYFRTLDANTELIAVFSGEHWIDPTHYVTITSHRDGNTDTTDAAAETARIKQLVGQLQNNLCNVSVMSDPDLESLSNMDPNSLVDITGKDFMEQLKDSGRPLCAKRTAEDRINLLKLLKDGAIFCSERYPEDAEAIDMEISRQLNVETTTAIGITVTGATATAAGTRTATGTGLINNETITTTTITKTIEQVQNDVTTAAGTATGTTTKAVIMDEMMMSATSTQTTANTTGTTTTTKSNDI